MWTSLPINALGETIRSQSRAKAGKEEKKNLFFVDLNIKLLLKIHKIVPLLNTLSI